MGHRALVAYRRPDRRYDLRYSHWGGDTVTFADRISAETPLAGGAVDPPLLAAAIDRDRILTAHLDPCPYEVLYLVEPGSDYRVSTYRVCWLEWLEGRDGGRGAIVAVDDARADRRVRTWFRATKTTLADVVEMGVLSRRAARTYLEARVCEDEGGTLYTYGETDSVDEEYVPPDRRGAVHRDSRRAGTNARGDRRGPDEPEFDDSSG
ncbi:DUF6735 family protein [Natronolimnohabitans innermongolicus]|uniref:Uncharacterized protein n=1 Tax=Natronolimnohabitans innermongolicus JCM 12255 TaxID=1227499 RepID=L9WNZ5_9EURY|nr:DUF6735 family protein [Natronolimnohabitans innermongolicus]ELY50048.1 hypothetical protein C493_19766 [Natronolimnohabitans innermongolicus JCM 12255]